MFAGMGVVFSLPSSNKLRWIEHLLSLAVAARFVMMLRRGGLKSLINLVADSARALPGVNAAVDAAVDKEIAGIEKKMLGEGDPMANVTLPVEGVSASELLKRATSLREQENFSSGQKWAGIYHGVQDESELGDLQVRHWIVQITSRILQ